MAHRYNKRSDSSASKTNGEQSSQPSKEDEDENPHLFVYKKVRVLSPHAEDHKLLHCHELLLDSPFLVSLLCWIFAWYVLFYIYIILISTCQAYFLVLRTVTVHEAYYCDVISGRDVCLFTELSACTSCFWIVLNRTFVWKHKFVRNCTCVVLLLPSTGVFCFMICMNFVVAFHFVYQ